MKFSPLISSFVVLLSTGALATSLPDSTFLQKRTPPGIPTSQEATTELAALKTRSGPDPTGYRRDLFPHWISQGGECNTREVVLFRDGTGVVRNADCSAASGTWVSPYDGATWTAASDLDIDHVVPLSNAWKSGANLWTTPQRQAFANDLKNPQLIAVTDNVNQAKGDKSPDQWKPPLSSYYCTYAKMWVRVKSVYTLSITEAEKTALSSMLATC